ncbi:glycosyltransferase [Actinophytocola gossypii]|uniref:Glycosyltransferase n=1 Tax=Actinophytocola gossypii TaxID=2812003 RepID=A0ABT2JFN7_9PSEU|nr:glycosyltransferase [Actinophytocola gossypii]MCT2586687.1 glycosyltransferase [Actinophytocola gossypii]
MTSGADSQPDIDIMVPAFGDGELVRETVRSVLDQRDPHWRLTVIDDGVGGGVGGELGDWIAGLGDDRIRYLANPTRLGINRNFQRCTDESSADLVVLLGSDDRLLPDFVGRVRDVAARCPDAAFIHTGARVIGDDGEPVSPLVDRVKKLTMPGLSAEDRERGWRLIGGEELAASLLGGNWMYFPSVAFRGDALRRHGFREGYDIVLDLDVYLRILVEGGQVVLFAEPGIEYRRHAASLSSAQADTGSRFDEERAYFAEAAEMMAAAGWSRAARAARLHWTSRMHAVVKLPGLLAARRWGHAGAMLRGALATKPPKPPERTPADR